MQRSARGAPARLLRCLAGSFALSRLPILFCMAVFVVLGFPSSSFAGFAGVVPEFKTWWVDPTLWTLVQADIKNGCKRYGNPVLGTVGPEGDNTLPVHDYEFDSAVYQWDALPQCADIEFVASLGAVIRASEWTNYGDVSFFTLDPSTVARITPSGSGLAGSVGFYVPPELVSWVNQILGGPLNLFSGATGSNGPAVMHYAPDDHPGSGFPANLPTKAPPKPAEKPRRVTIGFDGNVYFFSGVHSTINGIPGGPGITPTGNDSFNIKDKYLFTMGAVINVPINATWTAALTGGFAEADESVTYNCGTYCTTGGVTPFSASHDTWLPGGYVGGRIETSLAIARWPGSTISFDYKHVMLASESVALGSPATRQVTMGVSGAIDLFTVRFAVPLRVP
jgi:hypothetical protein